MTERETELMTRIEIDAAGTTYYGSESDGALFTLHSAAQVD